MAKLAINGGTKTVPGGIFTLWPVITGEDKKLVLESLESRFMTCPYGPQIRGAEKEFAEYLGVKHVLMLNSGTAALHLAVAAAGIGPGDEVIVPSFTFLATALAALHNNAVPVFVDVDPDTFLIDPAKIEAKITPRTKAIIPVHLHGLCADMDEILAIAKKHNLIVIEDTAQAHGARYKGRMAGTMGDMAGFSVQASKNLPAAEGGFFATNDDRLADIANSIRLFGQDASFEDEKLVDLNYPLDRGRGFEAIRLGWQYLPGELPAALTRAQLKRLEANNENARANAQYLTKRLSAISGVTPPHIPENRVSVYHKFRVKLDPKAAGIDVAPTIFRDKILAALKAEGVECCLWEVKPVPAQKAFKALAGYGKKCPYHCPMRETPAESTPPEDYAVAQALLDTSIVLGSHSYPIIAQDIKVMEAFADAFDKIFANLSELF